QEDPPWEAGLEDIASREALAAEPSGLGMSLYRAPGQPPHKLQFKLFRRDRTLPISDVLPAIENLVHRMISERLYDVDRDYGHWWIQYFELEHPRGVGIFLASDG